VASHWTYDKNLILSELLVVGRLLAPGFGVLSTLAEARHYVLGLDHGAGTTTLHRCSFLVLAAASRQASITV
jgi:hypothetical protein